MNRTVGPPRGRADIDAFSEILTDSLNFPPRSQIDFMSRYEPGDVRLVRADDRVAGGLVLLETAQYFGGRRIAMTGVHAVAIAPEQRGSGVGRALLEESVRELARPGGPPIACLYPATQPIYRAVGFEQAGSYTQYRVPIAALPLGRHEPPVERLPSDTAAVAQQLGPIYARFARRQNGFVDRSEWFWRRQVDPLNGESRAVYAVREQGAITGYTTLRRRWQVAGHNSMGHDVLCREMVAETPAALRRLLTLIADDRSLGQHLLITGPPNSVDAMLLVEQSATVDMQLRWMVRILDAAAALEARGYPPGLAATVGFEIEDDLVEGNRGRLSLEVSGGRGRATRGAASDRSISLDVRALAALFTGYLPAEELARAGLAAGADDALAAATACSPARALARRDLLTGHDPCSFSPGEQGRSHAARKQGEVHQQAEAPGPHIEESYEKKGVSKKEAARRAYATVNKEDGGGKKPGGSGHGKKPNRERIEEGRSQGRPGHRAQARQQEVTAFAIRPHEASCHGEASW